MDERIRGLALLRATLTDDAETIAVVLAPGGSADLARHLAGFAAATLAATIGTHSALSTIDHATAMILAEDGHDEEAEA